MAQQQVNLQQTMERSHQPARTKSESAPMKSIALGMAALETRWTIG